MIVSVNDTKINVRIDNRQQKYIQKEYPPGSKVLLKLDSNKWAIISMPSRDDIYTPEDGVSFMEVLGNPNFNGLD